MLCGTIVMMCNGSAEAEELDKFVRDYLYHLGRQDRANMDLAAAMVAKKMNEIAPHAGDIVLPQLMNPSPFGEK